MRICLCLLLACAWASADRVVLRDRTILEGSAAKSGKTVTVAGRTVPLAEVLLWEDDDGVAKNQPSIGAHMDGLRALAREKRRAACLALLPKAVGAGAGETARTLLERAELAGLDVADATKWREQTAQLAATRNDGIAVPGEDILMDLLVDRATNTLDAEETIRGFELLRQALVRKPKHENARDLLEEYAPKFWRVGDHKKDDIPRIWLDWQIDIVRDDVRAVGRKQPDIEAARNRWNLRSGDRATLHGAQTDEIVFVTTLTESSIVRMCVDYARVACKALDQMFKTPTPKRDPDDFLPLVIYMFANKQAYILGSGGPPQFLAMTAGHYSPATNISKFFWPVGSSARIAVRDTFVHELTHHWIQRRHPRCSPEETADTGARTLVKGYWIVEGFATFIEEGRYNPDLQTWSHFNAKCDSIDIVANLSDEGKLIPWEKLYPLTQQEFHGAGLKKEGNYGPIKKKWGLRPYRTSEIRVFYEQSAATCHFLYWAENGKYREQLLDYVTHLYTLKEDKTSIDVAFGMKPGELGAKVEKWCKSVLAGWRPKAD